MTGAEWQEYQGDLPAAVAGLGAEPVHHDDAWWVKQPDRVLVYPTGLGKALKWPGMAAHHPSATPDAQRWALAGGRDATALDHDIGGHPSRAADAQKWGGVGDAGAFAQAATDLHNQVELPIQAGDTYLAAGDTAGALSAYKAAGQGAATSLGPEIDAAGAVGVTQKYTQYAWALNGQLASATDATAAQGLAREMLVTYQDAINDGVASLSNPPSPSGGPSAALLAAAQALKAYLDANGVPPRHTKLSVTGDFQSAYIADGNTLKYGADSEYGPATAAALARVLGASPAPAPPAPGPRPGPSPGPGPTPGPITPSASASGDYTTPILIGAAVLAVSIVGVALYKQRSKSRSRAHAHA